MKLLRTKPCAKRSAIRSQSLTSVLRPGYPAASSYVDALSDVI